MIWQMFWILFGLPQIFWFDHFWNETCKTCLCNKETVNKISRYYVYKYEGCFVVVYVTYVAIKLLCKNSTVFISHSHATELPPTCKKEPSCLCRGLCIWAILNMMMHNWADDNAIMQKLDVFYPLFHTISMLSIHHLLYIKRNMMFFLHQTTTPCWVPDSLIHRNFNFKTLTIFVE